MNNKIYAFIDSQNLNLGIIDQGWKLDFKRFRIYLKEKYGVEKAFLFIGYIPENQPLYGFLKKSGYKLVFKPTIMDDKGKAKGNVDAELVLYSVRIEYENYSKAVIVSGDGDFQCLVKYLAKEKKLLRVIIPNQRKYSKLFSEYRKYLSFMNDLRKKLEYKKLE
ncbi:MAG: NYN domain-containing protein [Candidatus Shapirobacteria bacterium]|jgi:uncharacterized LabA/DUF88 family protein